MATLAQLRANRINARRSTGARTPEGKARSSQNALKHGLTAVRIVLPGESAEAFQQLRADLVNDYESLTTADAVLLDQFAQHTWRLHRARGYESSLLARLHPDSKGPELSQEEIDHFRRYETAIQRDFYRAYDRIARLQRDQSTPLNPIGFVSQPPSRTAVSAPLIALCLLITVLLGFRAYGRDSAGTFAPPATIPDNLRVSYAVTLIPGDGIGLEVADAAARAVNATGVKIDWDRVDLTADVILKAGQVLPKHVIESLERTHLGLKGPVTTPVAGGFPSVNVALRKRMDLYANVRPVKTLPGLKTRYMDVNIDMVIFRENTEDVYSGLEHEVVKDVVESLKIITRTASIRIARSAFTFARQGRKKVTAVHKANIMKLSDGLFLRCCREVASEYPEIEYKELIVDNAAMQLVVRPETFDVLLLPNLYGDIVSDLAAGLVGGLGIVPGANIGEKDAVFEAVHGSAPDIAGKGIANPTALMLSSVMMLRHIGEREAADRLKAAIEEVYREGKTLTSDVGGTAGTSQFTDAVIRKLEA